MIQSPRMFLEGGNSCCQTPATIRKPWDTSIINGTQPEMKIMIMYYILQNVGEWMSRGRCADPLRVTKTARKVKQQKWRPSRGALEASCSTGVPTSPHGVTAQKKRSIYSQTRETLNSVMITKKNILRSTCYVCLVFSFGIIQTNPPVQWKHSFLCPPGTSCLLDAGCSEITFKCVSLQNVGYCGA